MWDLRRLDDDEEWEQDFVSLNDVPEEDESVDEIGNIVRRSEGLTNGNHVQQDVSSASNTADKHGSCLRVMEGHSKAVTALYFEDDCLVRLLVDG